MKRIVGILLIIILLLLLAVSLPSAKIEIGKGDFIAYWSASHLLSQGKNPYDVPALLSVEREIGWTQEYPYMAWNPPWLHLLLLPYARLPFTKAVSLWLITNIALIYICSVSLWRLFSTEKGQRVWWVAPLVAFAFVPTLVTLTTGQVSTLVLLGIVGSVFFITRGRDSLGGLMLFLTTIKPQLVYLFLPVAFLWLAIERRWKPFITFGVTLLAALSFLFWRLPSWLDPYLTTMRSPLLKWESPTIGGVMSHYLGADLGKYLGIIVLPVVLYLILRNKERLDIRTTTSMILLLSLPTSIFGWSYDQVILIFPLMQIAVWVVEGELEIADASLVVFSLVLYNAVILYLRIAQTPNELYYFWVPIAMAMTYLYSLVKIRRRATSNAAQGSPE